MSPILLCALWLAALPAPGPEPGTGPERQDDWKRLARKTRIVLPAVQRAFYRSGGRYLVGRQVYLKVESSVLRRASVSKPSPTGPVRIFQNRSVPLVIPERNRYWQQVRRHLDGAGAFSIRGVLRIPEHDPRRRVHLYVQSIKRTPGTWRPPH